jgi:folate-binding protein YgfZ
MTSYAILDDREILAISGPDARSFLQAIISNDASKITPAVSIYAALLTPQGKFLHDFIISQHEDLFLLDTEKRRVSDLVKRLNIFRLGSNVTIGTKPEELLVAALWNKNGLPISRGNPKLGDTEKMSSCSVILDPRLAALGYRIIGTPSDIKAFWSNKLSATPTKSDYDIHRLEMGVPDGSRDIQVNKSFLLESNFEELNGVAFDKGCYIGQENTARQKHRGTIRRRLIKVYISGPPPNEDEIITWENGEIGQIRSVKNTCGMAIVRLDRWAEAKAQNAEFHAGLATVVPVIPEWMAYKNT